MASFVCGGRVTLKLSRSSVLDPDVILKTDMGVPAVIVQSVVENDEAFPIGVKSNLSVEYVGSR